ncbi:MAG TPA: PspC domain-containing protein [Gemmatimonadota bacterium]|nr:PspC domain-containing protein [Gemmatimonadota bacterium]
MSADAVRPGLRRSREKRMIAGVIGGLAERYDLNVTLLRVVYVVVSLLSAAFPGILVYLLLWIIVPLEPPRPK